MAGRSGGERIDRLEQVVQVIADGQLSLQKLIAELATETRRGFDRVAQQFEETDRRMRQTDDRIRQTDERMRQTDEGMRQIDERIDKLVIAIRELIRHPIIPPA
jgi:methyl-accepting chemotaxis protein